MQQAQLVKYLKIGNEIGIKVRLDCTLKKDFNQFKKHNS